MWTYVRDERPFAGPRPPAALFFYSPDRKGEHARAHLKDFRGVIHADGCWFRSKSAIDSGMKSATDSDLISAIPI